MLLRLPNQVFSSTIFVNFRLCVVWDNGFVTVPFGMRVCGVQVGSGLASCDVVSPLPKALAVPDAPLYVT